VKCVSTENNVFVYIHVNRRAHFETEQESQSKEVLPVRSQSKLEIRTTPLMANIGPVAAHALAVIAFVS